MLILQAVKQRRKARDRFDGGSDKMNDTDVLMGLIRVAQTDYLDPAQSTFSQNTSAYKACQVSAGTYLPFADNAFVTAFDYRIKNEYATALAAMANFIDEYIDVGETGKHIRLVKALLELIEADKSIENTDLFYAGKNGRPIDKSAVCVLTDIYLPAFLSGIWHFIILNRADNTVGRATFESWHEKPNTKGAKWVYCGSVGEDFTKTINVSVPSAITSSETDSEANAEEEPSIYFDEPYEEPPRSDSTSGAATQIINSPAVFFSSGANAMQINNAGTLNIDRGGKIEK